MILRNNYNSKKFKINLFYLPKLLWIGTKVAQVLRWLMGDRDKRIDYSIIIAPKSEGN